MRGLDVRSVANFMLDVAEEEGLSVTNLHLNKSVYFAHVDCLANRQHRLVSAKIEAWKYGPVFRELYSQFKRYEGRPITGRAYRVDFDTGEKISAYDTFEGDLRKFMRDAALTYMSVPANLLVDMSHAKGGAWDYVWNKTGPINAGMEITDDVIRSFELPLRQRIRLQ